MSRTYRRTQVRVTIKKEQIFWYEKDSYHIEGGYGYDYHHYLSLYATKDELQSKYVEKSIKLYYQDAGSFKSWRDLKKILNNRYRELNRTQLHRYLKQEDGELQTYHFKRFDFGYFWD